VLDDFRAELVAHDDVAVEVHGAAAGTPGGFDELVRVPERVQVGTADPARQRAHEHLAGSRLRHRDVGHHQRSIAHDGRAHQSNISTVRATSPAFIARNASFTSSSLPRRLTISSSLSRPWR